jgi:hypothetical protein
MGVLAVDGTVAIQFMPSLSSRLRSGLAVAALSAAALTLPACAGLCGPRGGCGGKQEQKAGGCAAGKKADCGAAKSAGCGPAGCGPAQ